MPLVVAIGAAFISYVQKRTELDIAKNAREEDRKIAQQARENEQQIANDRLRQATLEAYYDRMTELLLEHGLRESAVDSEARSIARARTIAVVRGLDGERNRQLFAFLQASKLIDKGAPIIDLKKADFSETVLSGIDLSYVDLSDAELRGADLRGADLRGANLRDANLSGADLRGILLNSADLKKARLIESNLSESIIEECNLTNANLSKANLSNSFVEYATFRGADFTDAFLLGTTFRRSDLTQVNLKGANLRGAILWQADLSDAKNWTLEQFDEIGEESPTMPDGVTIGGYDYSGPTFEEWKAQYLAKRGSE